MLLPVACRDGAIGVVTSASTIVQASTSAPVSASIASSSPPRQSDVKVEASAAAPTPVLDLESPRPTDGEWATASAAANSADQKWAPPGFSMYRVREWVRVRSGPGYVFAAWHSSGGRVGKDYFTSTSDAGSELIVHTRPGRVQRGYFLAVHAGSNVTLQIAWPTRDLAATLYLEANPTGATKLLSRGPQQPIPDVPPNPAGRPAEADWLVAPEVNTASIDRVPEDCTVRMVSDWVKLYCGRGKARGQSPYIDSLDGFGTVNVDYFLLSSSYDSAWLELRVRPGTVQNAELGFAATRVGAAFTVEWPKGSPKPTVISLALK